MPGFPVLHYLFPQTQRPLIHWCHPIISFSVTPFSSCPQSFSASRSFPMSWFFPSGGQSIGASASVSVLPVNIQGWFPLGLTGLISLLSKGFLRVFSNTTVWKHQFFGLAFFMVQLSQPYTTTGKTIALTIWTFVGKVTFLLFNTLTRFMIAFLSRSKCLFISWLQLTSAVILEPKKIKSALFLLVTNLLAMKWWHQMPALVFCFFTSFHFHQEAL